MFAKLRIRGIYKNRRNSWKAIYIPLDDNRIPEIKSQRKENRRIAMQVCPTLINEIAIRSLSDDIRNEIENETILLEDLMQIGDKSEFQIFGFGYDSFSGSREIFSSKVYDQNDIEIE